MQSVKVTRSKVKTNSSPLNLFRAKRINLQRLETAKTAFFFFHEMLSRIVACFRNYMETERKLSVRFADPCTDKQTITMHLSSVLMALLTWLSMQTSHDKKYWLQYLGVTFITA